MVTSCLLGYVTNDVIFLIRQFYTVMETPKQPGHVSHLAVARFLCLYLDCFTGRVVANEPQGNSSKNNYNTTILANKGQGGGGITKTGRERVTGRGRRGATARGVAGRGKR